MSNDSTRLLTAKVRRDYQQQRVDRLAAQMHLAPADPEVVGIIDTEDGTLNKDVLDADLEVIIQEWGALPTEPGEYDELQLQMAKVADDDSVGDFLDVGPSHQCDKSQKFPMTVNVPRDAYPADGRRQLRYRIEKYNENTLCSAAVDLIFDKTAPWDREMPEPAILQTNLITDAFFTANPAGLKVTLPPYEDQDKKDVFALYYSDTPPVEAEVPDPVASGLVPTDRILVITKEDIAEFGDGHFYIVYILLDKATNRSQISKLVAVDVNLGALPDNLQKPVVPLAADGLLDLADAQSGIAVEIRKFDNARPTDFVEVSWGTSAAFAEQIGFREFPLSIAIPPTHLRAAYGAADDVVKTPVSYRILRHQIAYGPESDDVDVDFSVAGPGRPDPDPNWPDPVNTELPAPEVRGATSDTANVLTRDDAEQDAKLTFSLHADAEDGDLMDFYWDGILVTEATYTVATGDTPPIERTIPWAYILRAGNNTTLPVHYTIRKPVGAGNEQKSTNASVAADAVTIVPDAAEFLRTSSKGWLNCDSLWEDSANPAGEPAFKVSVKPVNQYLPNGGDVTMVWTAMGGRSGETEIPGVRKTETVTITKAQAENGFEWEVKPYATHILPIYDPDGLGQDGRGRVNYSLEFNGEIVTSKTVEAVVSLGTGSGTCSFS
ncbi:MULTISPECIES: hypothetical protein [unclassified Pseudomonas]|uniref:hypothetical protein n=1 Tax=unclassified Pseudomonas TaxID=196821 RepID=UPI000A2011CC|nr:MULTISPECIES: hypothetical protein [unclassified Pseudomonas]